MSDSRQLPRREMACGAVLGLAWASSMRAMMADIAASDGGSHFTWATFALLLLPGTVMGALMGWAVAGARPPERLMWAPLCLSLDPFAIPLMLAVVGAGWLLAGRGTTRTRWWIGVPSTLMLLALPVAMLAVPPDEAWRSLHGMWLLTMASSMLGALVIAETLVVQRLSSLDRQPSSTVAA